MTLAGRAKELAERWLARSLPRRWAHVQGVAARAQLVTRAVGGRDADLLIAAAFLHDIGYAPELRDTGLHALDGARYLSSMALPSRLCALVAHHSCSRVEAALRGLSNELSAWSDELTPLRDALWWADMTTAPDGDTTGVHERIAEIQERYGPEDPVTFFIRQAEPELVAAVERTEARLKAAGVEVR